MPVWLASWLGAYGLPLLFLGVLLETLGLPLSGEILLLAAGFLAQRDILSLPAAVATAAAAALLGDLAGYGAARLRGGPSADRSDLSGGRRAILEALLARHGAAAVVLAPFATGLRSAPPPRLLAPHAVGVLLWAATTAVVGWLFGHAWGLARALLPDAWVFTAAAALAVAAALALRRRYARSLAARLGLGWPAVLALREVGFVLVGLAAVALFARIAESVVARETTGFDLAAALALGALRSPALDAAMLAVTHAASAPALALLSAAVLAWCLARGDRRAALALLLVGVGDAVANGLLKFAFQRERPTLWAVMTLHSYSFPSGHAMAAVAVYGMLAVTVTRLAPALGAPLAVLMPLLALVVGASRVYLGVHWPTDVLAGFAAGAVLLAAGIVALERPSEPPPP